MPESSEESGGAAIPSLFPDKLMDLCLDKVGKGGLLPGILKGGGGSFIVKILEEDFS